ncbi:MAG: secretion system protein F [Anaerolineaceae bacterium]|nr:secretion system protein F [Anaerolineaceae bacterium]
MWFFLVGILVALAAGVLLYGLGHALQPEDSVEERLEAWMTADVAGEAAGGEHSSGLLAGVDRRVARRGFAAVIRQDLARAALSLTVTEWLLLRVGLVVVAFLLGFALQRNLILALFLAAIAYAAPITYLRVRQGRRLRAFNAQLPDVLDQMVGSLRVGYGLSQSVEWVGRQMPDPAGDEFNRVVREMQLGWSLPEALESMVRRIMSDDLALIVTAIDIHYETGGRLADILETVSHTIRERIRVQREINTLTSQQRYSGYVLMVMPIALAVVLMLLSPEYESQLFAPGPTLCIPIGAGLMMILGFLIMRRIVEIDI